MQSGPFKAAQTGVLKLGLGSTNRDGYLYVPPQYDPSKASSFILAIHAAGKSGIDALQLLYSSAASSGEAKLGRHEGQATSVPHLPHVHHLPQGIGTSSHAGLYLPGAHMHPPPMLTASG